MYLEMSDHLTRGRSFVRPSDAALRYLYAQKNRLQSIPALTQLSGLKAQGSWSEAMQSSH